MSSVVANSTAESVPAEALSDRRTLLPWFMAEFLGSYAANLYLIGCYDFAKEQVHASESQRLWISAFWGFAYIFIALLAGRVTEKFGPRRAAIGGATLSAIMASAGLLVIAFPKLWVLPAVMLPLNFTCTMIWPAIESGVTRSPGAMRLSSRIAVFNLSWGSAGFLAIFTHGIMEQEAWWTIFVCSGGAFLAAALLLWQCGIPAHMIGTHNVPDDAAGEHELDDPGMRRRAEKFLVMAWVANALAYTAIYVLFPTMTQLAKLAQPGASLRLAGMITSVWFVTRFLGFGLTSLWTGWHYDARWLIGSLAALAASFLGILTLHNLPALLMLQIIFGFSAALVFSGSLYYAMHVSSGHGGHAAFHEAVVGIGTTAGPVIGALCGTGELGPPALQRIALGVTGVMVLGIGAIAWMASRLKTAKVTTNENK